MHRRAAAALAQLDGPAQHLRRQGDLQKNFRSFLGLLKETPEVFWPKKHCFLEPVPGHARGGGRPGETAWPIVLFCWTNKQRMNEQNLGVKVEASARASPGHQSAGGAGREGGKAGRKGGSTARHIAAQHSMRSARLLRPLHAAHLLERHAQVEDEVLVLGVQGQRLRRHREKTDGIR